MMSSGINPNLVKTHYALRGELAIRADKLKQILKESSDKSSNPLPYDRIISCNLGDPLQFGQRPITYLRQMLAFLEYPEIIKATDDKLFPSDVISHGRLLLDNVAVGPYTNTKGSLFIRELVVKFLELRDGYQSHPDRIFLTNGASAAISAVLNLIICDSSDGIMLPLPQYPLYSAEVTLLGANVVNYALDEERNWSLELSELENSYQQATQQGIKVKAMVVINPGNPTGNHLTDENLFEIVQFCHQRNITLLADEVYQENTYVRPFKSFKKSLCEYTHKIGLTEPPIELYSFHSVSKGYLGECGRRGGYVECFGVCQEKIDALYKFLSLNLCSSINGQLAVAVMVNPPSEGSESYARFVSERSEILECYKRKAAKIQDVLAGLPGITCNRVEGALYLFPQLHLPEKACLEAIRNGRSPDEFYCFEMLNQAGICAIPGNAFGQKEGTFHFRLTILPPEHEIDEFMGRIRQFHNNFIHQYQ